MARQREYAVSRLVCTVRRMSLEMVQYSQETMEKSFWTQSEVPSASELLTWSSSPNLAKTARKQRRHGP